MTARRGLAAAVALVAVAAVGCSKDVAANDLEAGECIADELEAQAGDVEAVACDTEHRYEVFATFELEGEGDDGEDWPGEDEVEEAAADGCNGEPFTDHVGVPHGQSELYTTFLVPTEDTWKSAGDRLVVCLVFEAEVDGDDVSPVTRDSSLEGADR